MMVRLEVWLSHTETGLAQANGLLLAVLLCVWGFPVQVQAPGNDY